MTKFKLIRLKNSMVFSNGIANLIGVSIAVFLARRIGTPMSPELSELGKLINRIFIPCSFILPIILTVIYEGPIRHYLKISYKGQAIPGDIPGEIKVRARQRLLNEPFFLITLDFCLWLFAAILYSVVFWIFDGDRAVIYRSFSVSLFTGLITITVAFFVFEHVLQRITAPFFFPKGGLYATPKTLHIRIHTRLIALLFACNIVPFIAILTTTQAYFNEALNPALLIDQLKVAIFTNAIIFMGVGIWATFLVSSNLTNPLREIIRVLQGVRNGQFENRVRVASNDEIGYTGDVINEMNAGLKERDLLKDTFGKYVSKEIRDEVLSGRIPLDGEKKEVTILFSDIRNFTPLTESNDPKLVIRVMNSYFKEMAEAIKENKGLVLQFIGDEIYAVFGAPISRPDHAVKAFRAGLEMKRRLVSLNKQFELKGLPGLQHGIGIHTGDALAANIGSPDRLSYLLVGDTVNLASRLQSLTKEIGVEMILSGHTFARLSESERTAVELKKIPTTSVKGKAKPVDIYVVK